MMPDLLNHLALGWWGWVWPMFWQTSLLIVVVALADLLVRRWAWSQVRYALWLLVLVKLVLPPSLASPASLAGAILGRSAAVRAPVAAMTFPAESRTVPPVFSMEPATREATTAVAAPAVPVLRPRTPLVWQVYPMAVWFAGVVVLGVWVAARFRGLRREYLPGGAELYSAVGSTVQAATEPSQDDVPSAIRRSQSFVPSATQRSQARANLGSDAFQESLRAAAAQLHLRRLPAVVFSPRVESPAVFGLLRPVLVMPAEEGEKEEAGEDARTTMEAGGDARTTKAASLRHVLLHELAHIKRGDLHVLSFCIVLQILYWFHPLLWLVRRRLQHLRELCCDATVASILREETPRYRETLVEAARRLLAPPGTRDGLGLLGLIEQPGNLIERLRRLEGQVWRRARLRFLAVVIVVVAMCVAVVPMVQSQPRAVVVEKENAETALKPFYAIYRLDDGEVLRRIAPPFIPERAEWHRQHGSGRSGEKQPNALGFAWNGKLQERISVFGFSEMQLSFALECCGLADYEIDGPADLRGLAVPGDWVVREGTSREALLQALTGILKKDLGRDIRFVKREVERDALVARGSYRFSPIPENSVDPTWIHVYVDTLDPTEGGFGNSWDSFLSSVVACRVVDETASPKPDVKFRFSKDIYSDGARTDPDKVRKVLDNLTKQTAIEFTLEKRPTDVWFVTEGDTAAGLKENAAGGVSGVAEAKPIGPEAGKPLTGTRIAAGSGLPLENTLGKFEITSGGYADYDETSNTMKFSQGARLRSEKLNLDCDELVSNLRTNLTAKGTADHPVRAGVWGTSVTCQTLEFYADDGKTILTGKPVVRQIGPSGNVMETRGSRVTLINTEGRVHVLVDPEKGGGEVASINLVAAGTGTVSPGDPGPSSAPALVGKPAVGLPDAVGPTTLRAGVSARDDGSLKSVLGAATTVAFDGNYSVTHTPDGQIGVLKATQRVRVRSSKLDLDCDTLTYDGQARLLTATGQADQPVRVVLDGATDNSATCQKFEFYGDGGSCVLTGDAVIRRAAGPRTEGARITIIRRGGWTRMAAADETADGTRGRDLLAVEASLKPFYEAYRLDEGELIRHVPKPFLPGRAEYCRLATRSGESPDSLPFLWDGGLEDHGEFQMSGGDVPLGSILRSTAGLGRNDFLDPGHLLALGLSGDWIARKGASQDGALRALEPILQKDLGRDIRFTKRSVEREVLVARGTFQPGPRPTPEFSGTLPNIQIHLDDPDWEKGTMTVIGSVGEFLRRLGDEVNVPVADETQKTDAKISWWLFSGGASRDFQENPLKLSQALGEMSKQTGLTFALEKRLVDVWFVSEGANVGIAGADAVGLGTAGPTANADTPVPAAPGSGQPKLAAMTPRVLHFPQDRSVGTLFLRDRDSSNYLDQNDRIHWQKLGDAQGDVAVPAGKDVEFVFAKADPLDVSVLNALSPDDLYALSLGGASVDDAQLAAIERLTGLRELDLDWSEVTDAAMVYVAPLTHLRRLTLSHTRVGDAAMVVVGQLATLEDLNLYPSSVTDDGLRPLEALRSLQSIQVSHLGDHALASLGRIPALRWVHFYDSNATPAGVASIATLPLERLDFQGLGAVDAAMPAIGRIVTLRQLSLNNSRVGDAGVASLAGLKSLEMLHLTKAPITDVGLKRLEELPSVNDLWVQGCGITREGLAEFWQAKPQCKVLASDDKQLPTRAEAAKNAEALKTFYALYRLDDGENLRRIAPPFIDSRGDYYRLVVKDSQGSPDQMVLEWDGSLLQRWATWRGNVLDAPLGELIPFSIGLARYEFEGPDKVLALNAPGDWITRKGASPDDLARGMEEILKKDLGREIRFAKRQVERDVIVARGQYAFHPLPGKPPKEEMIYFCVNDPGSDDDGGGGGNSINGILKELGNTVHLRVIDETPESNASLPYRVKPDATFRQTQGDPEKIRTMLDNLTKQTSLQFTLEKRMVDVWFVSDANPAVGLSDAVTAPMAGAAAGPSVPVAPK